MALSKGTQIGLVAVAIGVVVGLVVSDPGEGVLDYVYANEVVDAPQEFAEREFRVHGFVVEGSVRQKKGSAGDYTFEIHHDGKTLAVHYADMVPDTFAEGGEVVLTGRLVDGRIEATEMSAKCPSKYEENADPLAPAPTRT
jgi:cytochrome c-type biogenesis protein CcmE